MFCSGLSARLGSNELRGVGALEEQLGVALPAFDCYALEPAPLADEQVETISALEERLGVALVAVAPGL